MDGTHFYKRHTPQNVRKNYGNNGIYGRFSNTTEAFGFLAPLHSRYRSGHITCGYRATSFADPSATSHIRRTLSKMLEPVTHMREDLGTRRYRNTKIENVVVCCGK